MIVKKQYDSHVHWLMTGQAQLSLSLSALKSFKDLSSLPLNSFSYRGSWIYGFGWDENNFTDLKLHCATLDVIFKDQPVFFVRTDGHSSWVNTKALEVMGLHDPSSEKFQSLKEFIVCDEQGQPTGHLKEKAHLQVYSFLPEDSVEQVQKFLLAGTDIFHKAGFTHIRDMTSSLIQWQQALELENENRLRMHVEHNMVCESVHDLEKLIQNLVDAKKSQSRLNKLRGVKIFYDGSLGSETAYLSLPYASGLKGNTFFSTEELKIFIRESWKAGLDISFHVIGDQAAHDVVQAARKISAEGILGKINLEHAQVLRPETIQIMKALHIRCHLQPCHWLTDRKWLKTKLGNLYKHVFPWEALRKAQVPFHFGSDSPIEPSSMKNNFRALAESSKEKIPRLQHENPILLHQYPFEDSVNTESRYEGEQLVSILFDGKEIISR